MGRWWLALIVRVGQLRTHALEAIINRLSEPFQ
jgi:hypothetical protein